jgi:hypothetical protein
VWRAAQAVCVICAIVSTVAYVVLIGTPGIQETIGWPLFGVHLLSALIGMCASVVAIIGRRWWCVVPGALCAYILMFQSTTLVPSPSFLY